MGCGGACLPAGSHRSRLVKQVMTAEPYASADRVFWIAGNGSCHRGAASIQRLTRAWSNAHLIHLPAHASWLDQAEIHFSIVQRKVINPNDVTIPARSATAWPRSKPAGTPSPDHSAGPSPAPASINCCTASTPTKRLSPRPSKHEPYRRRTNGRDHLVQ